MRPVHGGKKGHKPGPPSQASTEGTQELSDAVDLISQYMLLNHHSVFCKKLLPLAISDIHYLNNVVGNIEICKGEGMKLDQLFHNSYQSVKAYNQPFDMETLGQAFQLQETAPVDLPSTGKGTPTISGKSKMACLRVS